MKIALRLLLVSFLMVVTTSVALADEPSFTFGTLMMDRALIGPDESFVVVVAVQAGDTASAPADTTNPALNELLAQFMADPESTDLSYDSWTMTAHRYLGWAVVIGAGAQAILGIVTYNKEKNGEIPSSADAHKYLGYTIVGLSVAQTTLGYYNFWQMRDRDTGKTKRWVHLTLSTLATAGFIAAAVIASDAREEIESGQAAIEGKTFEELYDPHAVAGTLAVTSVLLTAVVIVW